VGIGLVVLGSACTQQPSTYSTNTVATSVAASDPAPSQAAPQTVQVRIERPSKASSIQICIDAGPESASTGIANAALVLDAVAADIEQIELVSHDSTSPDLSRGLFVDVRTTASEDEGGGLLLDKLVPNVDKVELTAGMTPDARNAALLEQDRQRGRAPLAEQAKATLIQDLRAVQIPATTSSDILRCVSRANAQFAGRDGGRRLLLIVSPLSITSVGSTVRGDLASTAVVMVLGWGKDFQSRDTAWRATWASAGATSKLYVYDVTDGSGGPLRDAIRAIL
jgi:hypothetical protein